MPRLPLVLFDIDGTLLRSGDPTHGCSVRLACHAIYGVDVDAPIPAVVLSGRTDRHILLAMLAAYGVPPEESEPRLPEAFAFMEDYVAREIVPITERVLPGVVSLLAELVACNLLVGLVTGNLPRIAETKLSAAGIWEPFARADGPIGGFGHASVERNDLPPLALALATRALGRPVGGADTVVIGDTPHDIACGRACGARTLAVTTGRYDADALRPPPGGCPAPDLLLPDLADYARVLGFILGSG